MKRTPFRAAGQQGKRRCSVVSIFMLVWIFIMGIGGFYMFHLHRIMLSTHVADEIAQQDSVNVEEIEVRRSISDGKSLFPKNTISSQVVDKGIALKANKVVPKPKPKPADPKHIPDRNPVALAQAEKTNTVALVRNVKQIPKEKLKLKDMWKLGVAEQRQYLQDLRINDPEPSAKAANEFISYADASSELPIPPSIWDVPADQADRIAKSKPGQSVEYKIAGKSVRLPYGFPEESIFILTASYRDPEAASTIARAYARAAHPDRVFVGIHAQNAGGEDEPERDPIGGLTSIGVKCPEHPVCSRIHQVRVSRAHWSKSEGPTVARALAEQHFRNETYVLGVDSHCHFLRGWDNVAIDMFKRIGNDLAIITAYPPSYNEHLQRGFGAESYDVDPQPRTQTAICRTRRVNCFTTISFKHDMNSLPRPVNGPVRVAFFAAGFSFSRGHRILRVPYDYRTAYMFDGEETSMGVRAWTWGYDLYHPDRDIISHLYIPSKSPLRPVFWDAPDWSIQWPTQFGSILRLQKQLHIYSQLQGKAGPPKIKDLDLEEMDKYSAGPRRSPQEFFKWAKVDLQNNWGVNCNNVHNPEEKGKMFCYSENLCNQFKSGGMPYVAWAEGTEDLFPPMIRTSKYPPKH